MENGRYLEDEVDDFGRPWYDPSGGVRHYDVKDKIKSDVYVTVPMKTSSYCSKSNKVYEMVKNISG